VVGTGLNIKGFIVSVQYKYGLSNLSVSSASGGVMRNRVIALSASAIFSGK